MPLCGLCFWGDSFWCVCLFVFVFYLFVCLFIGGGTVIILYKYIGYEHYMFQMVLQYNDILFQDI